MIFVRISSPSIFPAGDRKSPSAEGMPGAPASHAFPG
jgi:hypothetical protein